MMRIYLASPYSDAKAEVMEERYEAAIDAVAYIQTTMPAVVYSPIVHWHPVAKRHKLPREHAFWINVDDEFITWAGKIMVLTLPGWKQSAGVQREIMKARYWLKVVQELSPLKVQEWMQGRC